MMSQHQLKNSGNETAWQKHVVVALWTVLALPLGCWRMRKAMEHFMPTPIARPLFRPGLKIPKKRPDGSLTLDFNPPYFARTYGETEYFQFRCHSMG
jgi:hypothetical protein